MATAQSLFTTIADPNRRASLETIFGKLMKGYGKSGEAAAARLLHVGQNINLFFSSSDVYTFLDPSGTSLGVEREMSKGVPLLSIARNSFILIPLLLTWVGLATITRNFSADNPLNNFFVIAIVDVVLFIVLIFIGLAADNQLRRARTLSNETRALLDNAIHILDSEISSHPQVNPNQPEQWARLVQQQLDQVRQVLQDVTDSTNKVVGVIGTVAVQMQTFQQGAQNLEQSANILAQEARGLTAAVQGISNSATNMANSATKLQSEAARLGNIQDQVRINQDQTNHKFDVLLTQMDTASKAMVRSSQSTDQIPTKLDAIAGKVGSDMKDTAKNLKKSSELLDKIQDKVNRLAHDLIGRPLPWPFSWFFRGRKQASAVNITGQGTGNAQSTNTPAPPAGQPIPTSQNIQNP